MSASQKLPLERSRLVEAAVQSQIVLGPTTVQPTCHIFSEASVLWRDSKASVLPLQIEKLQDAVLPVSEIVKRCPAKQLMGVYKVPAFESTDQFLHHIALARGKLKKGGTVDIQAAAKVVLQDWNDGRIPFYTMPPQREAQEGHAAAEVVTHFGTDFDAEQVCALTWTCS